MVVELPKDLAEPKAFGELWTMKIAGQILLEKELERLGLPPERIETVMTGLVPEARSAFATVDADTIRALVAMARETLDVPAPRMELALAIDEAAREGEERSGPIVAMAGDFVSIATNLMIFVTVLVVLGKVELSYDFLTGKGYLELKAGIPKGLAELVEPVAKTVSSLAELARGGEVGEEDNRPDGDDKSNGGQSDRPLPAPYESGADLSGQSASESGPATLDRMQEAAWKIGDPRRSAGSDFGLVPILRHEPPDPNLKNGLMSADDAERFKNDLFDWLDVHDPFSDSVARHGDVIFRAGAAGDRHFGARPLLFGLGLRPDTSSIPASNGLVWRVTVRIQSHAELKRKAFKALRGWFVERYGDLVSVRWTSSVVTLAANPDGHLGRWRGARSLKVGPGIGAAINRAGGPVGAVALIVNRAGRPHLLTAGHVLEDEPGDLSTNVPLFSPVSGLAVSAPPAATLHGGENFPRYRPGSRRSSYEQTLDYAIAEIKAGHVPTSHRDIGENSLQFPPIDWMQKWEPQKTGHRVVKSPARTGSIGGVVTSVETDIILENLTTGTSHLGQRLIEVSLDKVRSIEPGDSGALLAAQVDGRWRPLGIVVAGALTSRLVNPEHNVTSALYAVPIAAIPGADQMEAL